MNQPEQPSPFSEAGIAAALGYGALAKAEKNNLHGSTEAAQERPSCDARSATCDRPRRAAHVKNAPDDSGSGPACEDRSLSSGSSAPSVQNNLLTVSVPTDGASSVLPDMSACDVSVEAQESTKTHPPDRATPDSCGSEQNNFSHSAFSSQDDGDKQRMAATGNKGLTNQHLNSRVKPCHTKASKTEEIVVLDTKSRTKKRFSRGSAEDGKLIGSLFKWKDREGVAPIVGKNIRQFWTFITLVKKSEQCHDWLFIRALKLWQKLRSASFFAQTATEKDISRVTLHKPHCGFMCDNKTMAATASEGTAPNTVQVNAEACAGRSNSGNTKYCASFFDRLEQEGDSLCDGFYERLADTGDALAPEHKVNSTEV